MLRSVVVQRTGSGQGLTVLGDAPSAIGDVLRLDLSGGGSAATLTVQVTESRPVMIEGAIRYSLGLRVLSQAPLAACLSEAHTDRSSDGRN